MEYLNSLKQYFMPAKITNDSHIFRLHYKVTFAILIGCSALVTARQYVGTPIDCIVQGVPPNTMDTFCWFSSTFTVPSNQHGVIGRDIVRPGLGNAVPRVDEITYHTYYQWVCFVLAFQALLFYVPRFLWKTIDNDRIRMLNQSLASPIAEEKTKDKQIKILIKYFHEHLNHQKSYVFQYVFCEFLNLANVIGQIFLMNFFLNGKFLTYGIDVFSDSVYNPMDRVFPKMTKCTFHRYGASGSITAIDGLCILAINIINEKIYIFLWFWFGFLAIVTAISLIYRIIVLSMAKVRFQLFRIRSQWVSLHDIEQILERGDIGDWFLLYQLSKNIDPIIFKEFCNQLAMKLHNKIDAWLIFPFFLINYLIFFEDLFHFNIHSDLWTVENYVRWINFWMFETNIS